MLAYEYRRVSTNEQARSGLGLEAQAARNTLCADAFDVEIIASFTDDGVSGGIALSKRPAGGELINRLYANAKVEAIIVYDLFRMFRDVDDGRVMAAEWERRGVKLILSNEGGNAIDTSTALGKFLFTIRLATSEYERGLIGERTVAAMEAKEARGVKLGDPFGWRTIGGVQSEDAGEQAVIAEMLELNDGRSLRDIARALNALGRKTRDGAEWTHRQCSRVLARAEESEA